MPLADHLVKHPDYEGHEAILVRVGAASRTLQAVFLHRTRRGTASGGVRNHPYPSLALFLRDGLRLARAMSLKSALAGIWWGGGKALIARNSGIRPGWHDSEGEAAAAARVDVYEDFGDLLSLLRGAFVAAPDVGSAVADVVVSARRSRHVSCLPEERGGSGSPAPPTARGVVEALCAALAFCGMSMERCCVVVQGLGNVGLPLARRLLALGARRVIGTVTRPALKAQLEGEFAAAVAAGRLDLRVVADRADATILTDPDADAVVPCAAGGVLQPDAIEKLRAKIVCGAANNQLMDPDRDSRLLRDRGIVYVPDFLCNRMGIVSCADEYAGTVDDDPRLERHLGRDWDNSIYNLTTTVLERARRTGETTHEIAMQLAASRAHDLHPFLGHRGAQIVRCLVQKDRRWQKEIAQGLSPTPSAQV